MARAGARDALDLLDVGDLETGQILRISASVGCRPSVPTRRMPSLNEQRHQHRPLRVRMNTAPGADIKRREEQRRTRAWLEVLRFADVLTGGRRVCGCRVLEHEHVGRLQEFLLHAAGRDVDEIGGAVEDGGAAARAGDPALGVEVAA